MYTTTVIAVQTELSAEHDWYFPSLGDASQFFRSRCRNSCEIVVSRARDSRLEFIKNTTGP